MIEDFSNSTNKNSQKSKNTKLKHLFWIIPLVLCIFCIAGFAFYVYKQSLPAMPKSLDDSQQAFLQYVLDTKYPEPLLGTLPYPVKPANLFIYAKAGIVIDASNGCVLFEKNADHVIPPASMTKIAVMYVVFQAVANGETSLDTRFEPVKQAWARNAPPQSSLMGLAENQLVSVHELLMGLAVASGNDAATALAYHLSGSVEAFCERMNEEMQKLGLKNTQFVDASGYSELNTTTPREFAALARAYISKYPDALKTYHSAPSFDFPTKENYASNYTGGIYTKKMYASNKLLSIIEGCDGLKTGFIYESGFNISLTAKRGNTRFISVTMGGPGVGTAEGNRYRIADGKKLMNWAFASFETALPQEKIVVPVKVWQGKENALNLIEAKNHSLTVPSISENAASKVVRTSQICDSIIAPVQAGDQLGKVQYSVDGIVLEEIPLIADRTIFEGNTIKKLADKLAQNIIEKK